MSERHHRLLEKELGIPAQQIEAVAALLDEGGTVPFIARYRKERTGSLDEVGITAIRDRLAQLAELDKRREAIVKSLEERELLTDTLNLEIAKADTMAALEDLYLPYRPKRRTRATTAREKGLEPLARLIFAQEPGLSPADEAARFVVPEKGVDSVEDALDGARDIIAEWVSEDGGARKAMRRVFGREATLRSKVARGRAKDGAKYRDYFDLESPLARAPGHRVLAVFRGEAEGILKVSVRPPVESALTLLRRRFIKSGGPAAREVDLALEDGYKRLLAPSMENEIRGDAKVRADEDAIKVFKRNLREVLMASPLGQKAILAVDPGFRTGCKVVCLDRQGKLLHHTVIFPHTSKQVGEAKRIVLDLVERFQIEAIALGNGTASRESETFLRGIGLPDSLPIVVVNESGASIYSASEAAREEFPDEDVTVRGAVSIGRRLMDPLAELVKLDAKSIGVGQYQHDVDQGRLKSGLDDTVMSCVNGVGVEVNTASRRLLTYVSGLGPTLAKNIVDYRDENGPFRSRRELGKVPRLGPKAFEQAAGFLRVRDGKNPLDGSAVHPESYPIVKQMAKDIGCTVPKLMAHEDLRSKVDMERYVTDTVGLPTLTDILQELAKPGRDPRAEFEVFAFEDGVNSIDDLEPGMKLPGIVTNVTNFGAFVDVGVHRDGLVHVSQLADRYVKVPDEVVKVQQQVTVTVVEVDKERGRISLSMRRDPQIPEKKG